MNIQIPVKEYQSSAEMIREAQQRRMRLMYAQPAKPQPVATVQPAPAKLEMQHDAHVIGWKARRAKGPALNYLEAIAEQNKINLGPVIGRSRKYHVVRAKMFLIYEVKKAYPGLSLKQVGRLFGGLDHGTVLHAIKTHAKRNDLPILDTSAEAKPEKVKPPYEPKPSGEKYIYWDHNWNKWVVRVWCRGKRFGHHAFHFLDEAVDFRNKLLAEVKNAPSL